MDDLSNWYIRRSRKRFWKSENDTDKDEAYATLHHVLVTLSKMLAPFSPFISEDIYRNLTGKESVHLADLPTGDRHHVDEFLNDEMRRVREIVTEGLQLRAQAKLKFRQPLAKVSVKGIFQDELMEIIQEELNVKEVVVDAAQEVKVVLDTTLTAELIREGKARELVRYIQELRKEAGFEVDNKIKTWYNGISDVFDKFGALIAKETLSETISEGKPAEFDIEKSVLVDGEKVELFLKKV